MRINSQREPIELTNSVDARRPNFTLAILYIPKLEVTTPPFFTVRSKFEIYRPLRLRGARNLSE